MNKLVVCDPIFSSVRADYVVHRKERQESELELHFIGKHGLVDWSSGDVGITRSAYDHWYNFGLLSLISLCLNFSIHKERMIVVTFFGKSGHIQLNFMSGPLII